jgi:Na+-transporting methylmalonyl-CoA/oxaloacetate decarboxylase gamma subunit
MSKAPKEKQQMMIIGLLVVVMLGVGVFQFTAGSAPEPAPAAAPTEAEKEASKKADQEKEKVAILNPTVSKPFSQRDPFQPAEFSVKKEEPVPEPPKPSGGYRPPRLPGNVKLPPLGQGEIGEPRDGGVPPMPVEEPKFGYTVSGVIVGSQSAAVFKDAQGNQILVKAGAPIDGDAKVLSIKKGKVTVQFHNKTIELPVGGNE